MAKEIDISEPVAANPDQVEQYAFRLFAERSARLGKINGETLAVSCLRDATAFLDVARKWRDGEISVAQPRGPVLADACAPNLRDDHPINMISQQKGSIPRVRQILAHLKANPALETLDALGVSWGKPEVNAARAIFPAYAETAAGSN